MGRACLSLLLTLVLPVPAGLREEPAFARLFTPKAVPPGTYRTYVSSQDLDGILSAIRADPSFEHENGSFEAQSVIASEAFGQSGGYNRWKLALLYGAKRTRVARGPRREHGRVIEAWTLISPYPDVQLERLNNGTLVIVLSLQP